MGIKKFLGFGSSTKSKSKNAQQEDEAPATQQTNRQPPPPRQSIGPRVDNTNFRADSSPTTFDPPAFAPPTPTSQNSAAEFASLLDTRDDLLARGRDNMRTSVIFSPPSLSAPGGNANDKDDDVAPRPASQGAPETANSYQGDLAEAGSHAPIPPSSPLKFANSAPPMMSSPPLPPTSSLPPSSEGAVPTSLHAHSVEGAVNRPSNGPSFSSMLPPGHSAAQESTGGPAGWGMNLGQLQSLPPPGTAMSLEDSLNDLNQRSGSRDLFAMPPSQNQSLQPEGIFAGSAPSPPGEEKKLPPGAISPFGPMSGEMLRKMSAETASAAGAMAATMAANLQRQGTLSKRHTGGNASPAPPSPPPVGPHLLRAGAPPPSPPPSASSPPPPPPPRASNPLVVVTHPTPSMGASQASPIGSPMAGSPPPSPPLEKLMLLAPSPLATPMQSSMPPPHGDGERSTSPSRPPSVPLLDLSFTNTPPLSVFTPGNAAFVDLKGGFGSADGLTASFRSSDDDTDMDGPPPLPSPLALRPPSSVPVQQAAMPPSPATAPPRGPPQDGKLAALRSPRGYGAAAGSSGNPGDAPDMHAASRDVPEWKRRSRRMSEVERLLAIPPIPQLPGMDSLPPPEVPEQRYHPDLGEHVEDRKWRPQYLEQAAGAMRGSLTEPPIEKLREAQVGAANERDAAMQARHSPTDPALSPHPSVLKSEGLGGGGAEPGRGWAAEGLSLGEGGRRRAQGQLEETQRALKDLHSDMRALMSQVHRQGEQQLQQQVGPAWRAAPPCRARAKASAFAAAASAASPKPPPSGVQHPMFHGHSSNPKSPEMENQLAEARQELYTMQGELGAMKKQLTSVAAGSPVPAPRPSYRVRRPSDSAPCWEHRRPGGSLSPPPMASCRGARRGVAARLAHERTMFSALPQSPALGVRALQASGPSLAVSSPGSAFKPALGKPKPKGGFSGPLPSSTLKAVGPSTFRTTIDHECISRDDREPPSTSTPSSGRQTATSSNFWIDPGQKHLAFADRGGLVLPHSVDTLRRGPPPAELIAPSSLLSTDFKPPVSIWDDEDRAAAEEQRSGSPVGAFLPQSFWDGIGVDKEFRLTSLSGEIVDDPGLDEAMADPDDPGPSHFGPSIFPEGISKLGRFADPTQALFTASLYNAASAAPSAMLESQLHDAESVVSADSSAIHPASVPPSAPPSISGLPPPPPPPTSTVSAARSRAGSVMSDASRMSGSASIAASKRGRSMTCVTQNSPRSGSISTLQKIPEGLSGDTMSQSGMPSSEMRVRASTVAAGRRERRVSLADTVKFSGGKASTYDAVPKTESALLAAASVL
ncbi:hypothetical protein CYMTET_43991 [Cymbomonas tetramitiformis]|uniref:Uncharacterized protein n=1 Tax=Cymbomonas tetramitiformis TaxID=36881 RepID=A0AAE0EZR8_9CHLO|nr:hypothetical protein CYMTET_43991 [Cymbomonas tetramitiformis]